MEGYTDKEKELIKQYGDYMKSAGFYSVGGGINCWRYRYGEDTTDTFWIVDLYCEGEFSPRVYQFRCLFVAQHLPSCERVHWFWICHNYTYSIILFVIPSLHLLAAPASLKNCSESIIFPVIKL